MEVKSISECLNRIDIMIFDKCLNFQVKVELELIRSHIEWRQADCLSVLKHINHIIERFYSYDIEEELDGEYNKLRQKILDWYDIINAKPEVDNQQKFHFKEIEFKKDRY